MLRGGPSGLHLRSMPFLLHIITQAFARAFLYRCADSALFALSLRAEDSPTGRRWQHWERPDTSGPRMEDCPALVDNPFPTDWPSAF